MSEKINVQGTEITIITINNDDFISLTDMLKAKDGEFFISDWLRNRNTIEFLGIWEKIYNPAFNYGEFAIISVSPKSPLCDVIPAEAGIQVLNFTRNHRFRIESGMTNSKNRGFRTDTN